MDRPEGTIIGRVRHVLGSTVTVSLDPELAGIAPLWEGRLYPIGQIGSIVRLPQGPISLLASVMLVGIAELSGQLTPSTGVQVGDRWLQVQLLGEVDSLGSFRRGVSQYPGLEDPVHFTTPAELRAVYPSPSDSRVRLGSLAAAPDVPLALDAARLVTRHGAVVGSTGSGKTNAVAALLQNFVAGGWTAANIVVVDPHGEYISALKSAASIRSVLPEDEKNLLRVPFWALPAADILRALAGGDSGASVSARFAELVTELRRDFAAKATWLDLEAQSITADTPIPFDIREVWYRLDSDNRATYEKTQGGGQVKMSEEGNAASLTPTKFEPYAPGNAAPFRGPLHGSYATTPDRMRLRLADRRFRFFLEPTGSAEGPDPLLAVVSEWLGGASAVSVLDFSGVPGDVADLAIGAVLNLLFELSVRGESDGIGRARPVFVVLEEAHRYLSSNVAGKLAAQAADRIAREGRKYGIGLLLVTQRPSDLPDTALAQCGTIIALRLTNAGDQSTVRAALPDSVVGLADVLPSLRTGEAIVSGEAVVFPSRVLVDKADPEPQASDPVLSSWRKAPSANDVSKVIARWRGVSDA